MVAQHSGSRKMKQDLVSRSELKAEVMAVENRLNQTLERIEKHQAERHVELCARFDKQHADFNARLDKQHAEMRSDFQAMLVRMDAMSERANQSLSLVGERLAKLEQSWEDKKDAGAKSLQKTGLIFTATIALTALLNAGTIIYTQYINPPQQQELKKP
jgi:hypothetical protein